MFHDAHVCILLYFDLRFWVYSGGHKATKTGNEIPPENWRDVHSRCW